MANQYSQNLGLDLVPLTKDPENLGDIYRLYNAVKLVMTALDSYTGAIPPESGDWSTVGSSAIMVQNLCRHYAQAATNITPGQLIALNSSGQFILGTVGNVIGWAPLAINSGAYGEIKLLGLHTAVAGLTPGVSYYASSTAGAITSTVTAQKVGFALAANRLFFNPA